MTNLLELLKTINNGAFLVDCETSLNNVIKEIHRLNSAGELEIKIKIKPDATGELVSVIGAYKEKRPRRQRSSTEYYLHNNKLSRENPRQAEMFKNSNVVELDAQTKTIKEM